MKASLRGENQQMAILSPTPNVMTESGGGMTDLRKWNNVDTHLSQQLGTRPATCSFIEISEDFTTYD